MLHNFDNEIIKPEAIVHTSHYNIKNIKCKENKNVYRQKIIQ